MNVSLCGQFLTCSVYIDVSFDVYWTEPGLVSRVRAFVTFAMLALQILTQHRLPEWNIYIYIYIYIYTG
jgi:hypothetical protein